MASSKQEAINYLGNEDDYINLGGFNTERDLANRIYDTQSKAYQNAYNELLNTMINNRAEAKTDFTKGRNVIGENAYLQDRASSTDFNTRGVSNGIKQLGVLGNRIETGRQYSDLANTYYRTMNELDANERTATNQYNTNMETEKNNLASTLADVNAREAGARNQYRATVAQLAEQIQSRKAAEAQAAAARASLQAQLKKIQQDSDLALYKRAQEIAGDKPTYTSFENAIKFYLANKSGNRDDAVKWLNDYGIQYLEPSVTVKDKSGNVVVDSSPANSVDLFSYKNRNNYNYNYYDEYGNKIN